MSEETSKGTILIVDDEHDVLFFISKVCQPHGYHTITASSGLEALKYIEELGNKINLVLLDLKMPGMGGMEVLKAIRKRHEHLPVIVLTALAEKKEECEQLGIEAFITKPYSLEELYCQITIVLDRRREEKTPSLMPDGACPSAKVLVVDDEKEVRDFLNEYLKEYLRHAKYEVCCASSGDEALRASNEFEPDIAIVDVKMQHMWGDELIERFKRGESFCPKDFIIFSATDIPEQRRKAAKAGYHYLLKLGQLDELGMTLEKICLRHGLLKKVESRGNKKGTGIY